MLDGETDVGYFDSFESESDMAKYAEVFKKQRDVAAVEEKNGKGGRNNWVGFTFGRHVAAVSLDSSCILRCLVLISLGPEYAPTRPKAGRRATPNDLLGFTPTFLRRLGFYSALRPPLLCRTIGLVICNLLCCYSRTINFSFRIADTSRAISHRLSFVPYLCISIHATCA
jgi:hypothetical protein